MPSSNPSTGPGVDPLAPLEQLTYQLMGMTVHVALGLGVGMLAARLMRSRRVHWTWAATGLALAFLARPALGSSTLTLSVAALSATVWSRRWHRGRHRCGQRPG